MGLDATSVTAVRIPDWTNRRTAAAAALVVAHEAGVWRLAAGIDHRCAHNVSLLGPAAQLPAQH
eukprot:scaffold15065_cov140-Isochrysis_galbana.AAC.2